MVSTPADRNERTSMPASASVNSPASTARKISMPRRSGASAARLHFDMIQSRTGPAFAIAFSKRSLRGPKPLNTMLP